LFLVELAETSSIYPLIFARIIPYLLLNMKNYTILFVLSCISHLLIAQNIWHKTGLSLYPAEPLIKLTDDNGGYQLSTGFELYTFDHLGVQTGYLKKDFPQSPSATNIWMDVIKKYDAGTGDPYFIFARRTINSPIFNLVVYRPGSGYLYEQSFTDTIASITSRTQVTLINLNDSTFFAFGRKYVRKFHFSPEEGFTQLWSHPLSKPIGGVKLHSSGAQILVSDESARFYALDTDGNELWSSNTLSATSIDDIEGGYVGCHRLASPARLEKYDSEGSQIWQKITEDNTYSSVVGTSGGGIAVTGADNSGRIILVKYNAEGMELWRRQWQQGTGVGLLTTLDGGFLIAAKVGTSSGSVLIKTDDNGNTPAPEKTELRSRRLKTAVLEASQQPNALFFTSSSYEGLYSVADSTYTFFFMEPFIGGKDLSGDLHFAEGDVHAGIPHFKPGVLQSAAPDFNRVWLAERDEINRMRADFGSDHVLNNLIPYDLLTWPGKGNPHLRVNPDYTSVTTDPNLFPAPFADLNNDGIYNVYDGDYPLIKGDKMMWWAICDSTYQPLSNRKMIGLDLLLSAYATDCPQSELVNHSIYLDIQAINRSSSNYEDMQFGFLTDLAVGCSYDDYHGTLPQTNSIYAYNKTETDYVLCDGEHTLGNHFFVPSFSFMNRSLDHSMFPYGNYASPYIPNISFPETLEGQYHILEGKWEDGTPLTAANTGYNPGNTDFTNYSFPANPSDPEGWNMCNADSLSWPIYRQYAINSHGPFSFPAGDTFQMTIQLSIHPDIPHPCPNIFGLVQPDLMQLQQWYDEGSLHATVDLGDIAQLPAGQSITLDAGTIGTAYQWSTGAVTPTIQVSAPGTYSVSVTLATGCEVTDQVSVQQASGTNAPAQTPDWTVYPNPAHGLVTVNCPDCKGSALQISLRNAQGSIIRRLENQESIFTLDTGNCPAGFYWVELRQNNQLLGSKKLVLSEQ